MSIFFKTTLISLVTLLGACSFVQLSDAGAGVTQLSSTDVGNCASVGVVSAETQDKVVLSRGAAKIAEELLVLARNQAGNMGANAIVPITAPKEGKQDFRAYRCD